MGLAGAFFAADLGVFNLSIRLTNIANATLFNNLAPVFVVFFGWLLFNEKVGVGVILASIVTLGGMALFMGNGFSLHAGQTLGDSPAILTAIFYAGYLATVKSLKSRHSTSRIMVITSAIGAAMLFPIMLLEGGVRGELLWLLHEACQQRGKARDKREKDERGGITKEHQDMCHEWPDACPDEKHEGVKRDRRAAIAGFG